eukprot:GEMP01004005.1.p1 GENE.GEMP01004005.1~~GEMP01004005.1.p1  ORF type:complete len:696 (+),score=98.55 GEMP01004005.1:831-2918(+)
MQSGGKHYLPKRNATPGRGICKQGKCLIECDSRSCDDKCQSNKWCVLRDRLIGRCHDKYCKITCELHDCVGQQSVAYPDIECEDELCTDLKCCTPTAKDCTSVNGLKEETLSSGDTCTCGITTCSHDGEKKFCNSAVGTCAAKPIKTCAVTDGTTAVAAGDDCTCGTLTCTANEYCLANGGAGDDGKCNSAALAACGGTQDGTTEVSGDDCTCANATCTATEYCLATGNNSNGKCNSAANTTVAGAKCGADDTSAQTHKSCETALNCVNSNTDEVCSGDGCTCKTPNAAAGEACGLDDEHNKSCESALKCVDSKTDEVCSGAGCTCKTPDALVGSACGNDDAANKSCAPDLECVNSNTYEACSGTGCACKTHFIDSTSPIIGEDSSACQGNPNAACTTKDDKLGKCDSTGMQCQPIDCNDSNVCELVLTDKTRTYIWYIIPIAIIIGAGCVWFIIICLVRRRNHNKFRFETQMDCERDLDAVILSEHQIQNTSPSAQPTPDTYCITEAVDLLPERLHGDRTGSMERLGPRDSNTGDEVRRSVTIWRPDELAQNTESVACGANLRPIELRERDTDARTRSMTLLASENTPERDHTKDGNRSLRVTEVPRPSGTCQMSEEPRSTEASHPSEVLRSSGVSLPSEVLRSGEVSHPTEVSHSSSTSLRRDTSRLSRARVRSRKSGSRIAKDAPNSRIPLE